MLLLGQRKQDPLIDQHVLLARANAVAMLQRLVCLKI
jgi:hypothetical protein